MAPSELSQTICTLKTEDKNLLVDMRSSDDASVYKLNDTLALVQTVDFITPLVDDPFVYGQIAAANSLSDIFAMGAGFLNALNVVGFDSKHHTQEVLQEILAGGLLKVKEAGGVITGGHTIETPEMYYGLSATGTIHPNHIWRNNTPRVGDLLLLTKPIGTGIVATAIKGEMATKEEIKEVSLSMTKLNQKASQILKDFDISACTDVSGFGLLGHALEMATDQVSFWLYEDSIPLFESAKKYSNMGLIPAGTYKNKEYVIKNLTCKDECNIILFDAQTSGGLLVSIKESEAQVALKALQASGYEQTSIIGQVNKKDGLALHVKKGTF